MSSLKIKQADGTWRDILMIKGDKGDAGVATEAIKDTLTDTEHTWSSRKISTELATKVNDIDLEIETVTADTTIASLMQKVEVGKSKKFQYTNDNGTDLPSDYPSIMLNAKAIFRPIITVNRITAGIMYLEIISPNQSTGVPKTITGYYNGTFYWNEELSMTNVANNLTTNQEGYALDARQGKALNDRIDTLNNNLANIITTSLSSASFVLDANAYVTNDITFDIPEGYKYLCTLPQNVDPIPYTAQIETTIYRRIDGLFTYILHNRYTAQLSGTIYFINIFMKS